MAADEEGTLAQLKDHRSSLWDPAIERHRGRIANTAGDSILAEFSSVLDAVTCAVAIQRSMIERNSAMPSDRRIEFRIGINLGEVIADRADIFGDGVNIAARLEAVADRGGICISRQVLDQVHGKIALTFRELGRQNLKNIAKPVEVYAIDLKDEGSPGSRFLAAANLKQEIRYCKAPDGVRLAYATVGKGPPILKSAHWLSHLEYDWELALFSQQFLLRLAKAHTLIRYDARGNGLSDWDVHELSLDAWLSDMEAVAEAAGLERFPLIGFSQGCAVSIAYAIRHPERVSHLILYGGFAAWANRPTVTAAQRESFAAMRTLVRQGWGANNPAFRQLFTSLIMPTASKEQMEDFNELQRLSASPECAARYLEAVANLDVRELLPQVKVPTLVIHVRDDHLIRSELGRELAAGIPGARFVALAGKNHVLLEQDPGLPRFFEELEDFLKTT